MTHPHAPPEPTPEDAGFLRAFFVTLVAALLSLAALNWLVDPLGAFGTGLLPPRVIADRDQKAALYRADRPPPRDLILGSSRSKTLDPACLGRLTGRPAFNFAVNGAATEDFLAIFRFVEHAHPGSVDTVYIGLDPETMQTTGGLHRALADSRALAPFTGSQRGRQLSALGSELFGWQAASAAVASLAQALRAPEGEPPTTLAPDGVQRYPRAERLLAAGHSFAPEVAASVPGILSRYESFPGLDSSKVASFRALVREVRAAGGGIVAFIPPVHPALERRAEATAWESRTGETVELLRGLAARGELRYVETRDLAAGSADTAAYLDGVHFLAPVATRVVAALAGRAGGCALQ